MSQEKLKALAQLRQKIVEVSEDENFLEDVFLNNNWFIPQFTKFALNNISDYLLDANKLKDWSNHYNFSATVPYRVGIITAGNIPLVGFHDLLCAYLSPHHIQLKISSKDLFLTKWLIHIWCQIDIKFSNRIEIVERITNVDRIIATGSNNSYQMFQHYFSKYNPILRKNRTSVGIIRNHISDEEIAVLMDDIFMFFGLGCRNISKLYIEKGFELTRLFEVADKKYAFLFDQVKYMNNYDYQRTLLLLNNVPHLANNFWMLKEDPQLFSPISTTHFSYFDNETALEKYLSEHMEDIQCVVGNEISYGHAQKPSLFDYADGIDVMEYLKTNI